LTLQNNRTFHNGQFLSEARKKPWEKFVNESSFEILLASFLQYTIKLLRHIGRHITASLLFLALFCTTIAAQDSTRRATPTPAAAPAMSPGASVNNPSLTVPPIITPLEQPEPRKPRRRRLTAADSVRIAAQRDSIARLAQMAQTATLTPQTTPNATPAAVGAVTPNIATPITAALSAPEVPVLDSSSNPFDILRGTKASTDSASLAAKQNADNLLSTAPSLLNKQTYSKNFLFWIFLLTLILMAFVVSNARVAVQNAYQALLSDNALRQIHRDQVGWGNFGQLALYGLFWLNMGIFVFLMYYRYVGQSPFGQFATFLLCVGGVSAAFLIKHTILFIVANVFPIGKEVKLYNYIILTGGIFLSLVLLPINIFIAYSPESLKEFFIYAAFGIIALVYFVRSLRSLSVASPFLMTDQFHFLLYLCAVEIAPIMILIKLLYVQ
jgi:hypothetical protein